MTRINYRGDRAWIRPRWFGPIRADMNRAEGTLVYEGRSIRLSDVVGISHEWLNTVPVSEGDFFGVKLVLADKSALMLELLRDSDEDTTRVEAIALAEFLGVPLDDEAGLMTRAAEELRRTHPEGMPR